MDKRQAEIDAIKNACQFLCDGFPNFFKLSEYTHPVKGVCSSLILKNYKTQVDISNVSDIILNFNDNRIIIKTEMPDNTFIVNKFVLDETVM